MKKDTTNSLLREIRDLLKVIPPQTVQSADYITIKDDGRKTSEIMNELRTLCNVYSYYSDEVLDKDFPPVKSERKFKNVQEADPENVNKSANDLKQEDCITLRERLLMEIQYFKKTGNHLDIENWTLCAGSRSSDGIVPCVSWNSDSRKVCVDWDYPGRRYGSLRARSAVKN